MRLMLTTDAVGGVWRYTMELAAGLRALGAEIRIVSLGPPPGPAQREEAGGALAVTDLALDWLAESPRALERSAQALAQYARDWGITSVHLHLPALAGLADWPAPVVAMAHSCVGSWWQSVRGGPLPADLGWRVALVREGLVAADVAAAPSRSFAAAIAEHYHLKRPVVAVLNGRDPMPVPDLPRHGVLTVGRLWDEAKNLAVLDRVAAPIRAAGALHGPHGATIRLGHIETLGSLSEPELARAYAGAEVFVSAARYEPFGLSVLEAAQAGCALVLSDIPTFRELWDGAALFAHPDDPDSIGAAIDQARAQAPVLAAAARVRARRYTRAAMARATLNLHRVREVA
jgi:glycosyltransferase involved in cell wall biosynthesis